MEIFKEKYKSLSLIALCFLFSGALSIYLGQDANWDLRNYHFYNPYAFLNGRLTFDFAPAQLQSFHSPFLDIPFYLMMNHLSPILYGFLVGGIHGINIFFVYKISYIVLSDIGERSRQTLSLLSGLSGFFGAANISEVGTCFHDNTLSLLLLGGLLLIISAIVKFETRPFILLKKRLFGAGLLFGISVGLKLTMSIYSFAFIATLLVIGDSLKTAIKNIFSYSFGLGIGIIISMGFWADFLWNKFNNPLFPYYNKIFKSQFFEHINFIDDRFFPRDIYQMIFYPFYFTKYNTLVSEIPFRDIKFAMCYILLGLMIFVVFYRWVNKKYGQISIQTPIFYLVPDKSKTRVFIIVFFVFSYVIWQSIFSIYRYLVPLELISPVFMILIIWYLFPIDKVFIKITIGVFILAAISTNPINWGRKAWSDSFFEFNMASNQQIEQSTVIMVSKDPPHGYIIPYFPRSTRFIHVNSNFFNPTQSNNLYVMDMINARIEESQKIYILCNASRIREYDSVLNYYKLKIDQNMFHIPISTKFDRDLILISAKK